MPAVAIDTHAPIRRAEEEIAHCTAKISKWQDRTQAATTEGERARCEGMEFYWRGRKKSAETRLADLRAGGAR